MRLKWDDANLLRLINLMTDARSMLPSILAKKIVKPIHKASQDTFVKEADVHGKNWAELKKPRSSPKKLAGLKKHVDLSAINKSIIATSDKEYTGYHQSGTRKMPARQFLPYDEKIPSSMDGDVKDAVNSALSIYFNRTGGQIVP